MAGSLSGAGAAPTSSWAAYLSPAGRAHRLPRSRAGPPHSLGRGRVRRRELCACALCARPSGARIPNPRVPPVASRARRGWKRSGARREYGRAAAERAGAVSPPLALRGRGTMIKAAAATFIPLTTSQALCRLLYIVNVPNSLTYEETGSERCRLPKATELVRGRGRIKLRRSFQKPS